MATQTTIYWKIKVSGSITKKQSGRRGSNPRPWAWEAHALPTELLPRSYLLQRYTFFVFLARIKHLLGLFYIKDS